MGLDDRYTTVRLLVVPISASEAFPTYTIEPIAELHTHLVQPLSIKPRWALAPTVLIIDGEPTALKVEDEAILAVEAGMELIRVPHTDDLSAYKVNLIENHYTVSVVPVPVNPNPNRSGA